MSFSLLHSCGVALFPGLPAMEYLYWSSFHLSLTLAVTYLSPVKTINSYSTLFLFLSLLSLPYPKLQSPTYPQSRLSIQATLSPTHPSSIPPIYPLTQSCTLRSQTLREVLSVQYACIWAKKCFPGPVLSPQVLQQKKALASATVLETAGMYALWHGSKGGITVSMKLVQQVQTLSVLKGKTCVRQPKPDSEDSVDFYSSTFCMCVQLCNPKS